MKKYKNLFIDYDGTMFNSYEGCKNAFTYAFNKYNLPLPQEGFYRYIGPTLKDTFSKLLNDEEDVAGAVEAYREFYLAKGKTQSIPFDGIAELLRDLHVFGYRLYVATGKLESVARESVELFGLLPYFDNVFGADQSVNRLEKGQVLEYALHKAGVRAEESLMIGDSILDVIGAKYVNMDCVAVLYGFGNSDELQKSSATVCVETVEELRKLLLN